MKNEKSKLEEELDKMHQEAVTALKNLKVLGKRFDAAIPHVTRVMSFVGKIVRRVEDQGRRLDALEGKVSSDEPKESDRQPLSDNKLESRFTTLENRVSWLEQELNKRDAENLR